MFTTRSKTPSLWTRSVAAAMICCLFLTDRTVLAAVDSTLDAKMEQAAAHPAPVLTPQHVIANRTPPTVTPPSSHLTFKASPTDLEIFQNTPLPEPLIPIGGKSAPALNAALAHALLAFSKRTARDDFSALESFLAAHPDSVWNVALENDLGALYYQTGFYSKAMASWQKAWDSGNTAAGMGQTVADEALSKLINLNASVGRMVDVSTLVAQANQRKMSGSVKARVDRAKEGLATMKSNPEIAFRCGPLATEKMKNIADGNIHAKWRTMSMASSNQGTSLLQIKKLSSKLGIAYQAAKRAPGSLVIVPSVINWKLGHFAAIVEKKGDLIRLQDPTFGMDVWVSSKAIDSEGSGYFLVSQQALPPGWRSVDDGEAATVWGKGDNTNMNPNNTGGSSPTGGGSGGPAPAGPGAPNGPNNPPPTPNTSTNPGCNGLANYFVSLQAASLIVQDTPLFYRPAYGPDISFTITYDQREADQPAVFSYSNLGPLWTFNWLSYLVDDPANPGADLTHYLSGGGELTYTGYSSATQTYAPQTRSGAVVKMTGPSSYELDEADGSVQIFNVATNTSPRKIFLTKTIDPSGNGLTFTYDSNYRLVSATDAAGLVTTVSYQNAANIYQITKVTDPFGRYTTLSYNSSGFLQSSADVSGFVSQYNYGTEGLSSLTTPYGTTSFNLGQDSDKRYVQVTDPQGGQERFESWDNLCPNTPASETLAVPSGFDNMYLNYRNTFSWDKKQMQVGAGNYADATIHHWLHETNTATVSDVVESVRYPLESRQYLAYAGQPSNIVIGTSEQPTRVARTLDDGSTQETDAQYNILNNLTQFTDAVGRVTNYTYAANNIDLVQVNQGATLPGDLIATYTYYPNHLIHVATDASGQTTTYTYNGQNQLQTATDAKNEVTTRGYSGGHLISVTDNTTGAAVGLTYDSFGRVQSFTDYKGYKTTYNYDNLNRITLVTYPDSTTDQYVYTTLNVTQAKDRQNRWSRYFYNSVGQLVASVDPQDHITNYDRCTCGELKGLIDANGHRTSWDQDIEGRITSKTFADQSQSLYGYESTTDRVKTVTDAKGQISTVSYNHDNTVQQIAYTDASVATPTIGFSYDSTYPRITSMTDASGSTNYHYNPVNASVGSGRLWYEVGPLGSTAQINYTYDQLGRQTATSVNGVSSSVVYDSLSRITSANNALGSFTYGYSGTTYLLKSLIYPNGQNTTYAYQSGATQDFRLADISNFKTGTTVLSKFDYTYNPTGSLATWQQQTDATTPTAWTYQYDKADQLLSAVKTNTSTQAVLAQYVYGYDPAGNRLTEQIGLNVRTTTFNNLNQIAGSAGGGSLQFSGTVSQPSTVTVGGHPATMDSSNQIFAGITTVAAGTNNVPVIATNVNGNAGTNSYQVVVPADSSTAPSYDLVGNLTNNGAGQSYQWDARNELTAIIYSSGSNAGNHTEFVYDGLSRRVAIVEKSGTTVGSGSIIGTKQLLWIGTQIAEERDASGSNVTKRFFNQGEQISGTSYYYTRDHLGSVREMTDSSGNIVARYDYDPYGRVTTITGTVPSDFQYAGYYTHATSGLNLTLNRAYDPTVGRWLSRDPMGEGADATLYSYVWNGPVNRIDPLGLAGGGRGSGPSNGSEAITVAADAGLTDFNALQQSAAATANGATFGLAQAIDPTDFTPQPGNEYNQETSALLGFSGTVIVIAALGLSAAPPPPDDDDGGDATPTPKPPPAMPDDMFPPIKYPPPGVTRPAPVPVPSVGPMPGSHSGGC